MNKQLVTWLSACLLLAACAGGPRTTSLENALGLSSATLDEVSLKLADDTAGFVTQSVRETFEGLLISQFADPQTLPAGEPERLEQVVTLLPDIALESEAALPELLPDTLELTFADLNLTLSDELSGDVAAAERSAAAATKTSLLVAFTQTACTRADELTRCTYQAAETADLFRFNLTSEALAEVVSVLRDGSANTLSARLSLDINSPGGLPADSELLLGLEPSPARLYF